MSVKLKRFSFYDRLLLLILSKKPSQGKFIFQSLFKNNSTKEILNFLDEKSTFFKDLNTLVHAGPTLTNVNDFRILLIDSES